MREDRSKLGRSSIRGAVISCLEGRFRQAVNLGLPRSEAVRIARG